MVEDKIGTKPYLGIEIDYDKEKHLISLVLIH